MNFALILAAGVGQRMRSAGMPKQFLKLFGKPIIVYTLEKFEQSEDIDKMVVVCREGYTDHLSGLLSLYHIEKVEKIIIGGDDRQSSLRKGLSALEDIGAEAEDIVVIHDGVRPLISTATIRENVRVAKKHGCAVTVHPVNESVVITEEEEAAMDNFKKRAATYSLTSPQSFRFGEIIKVYDSNQATDAKLPLLDAAMVYAHSGRTVHLVKELGTNIKITTPEDFYYLKAMLELEENKYIFGL